MQSIPARLKSWREGLDLRQEHLAITADVSTDTVRNWERGTGPGPSIEHLRRLEGKYRGLVASLFGDLDAAPHPDPDAA